MYSLEELHRVAEQPQPVALRLQAESGPLWVLRRQGVALRVRHQAEDPAGRVADAGHVPLRPARVGRVRRPVATGVAQDDLPGLFESSQNPLLAGDEPALAVGDG